MGFMPHVDVFGTMTQIIQPCPTHLEGLDYGIIDWMLYKLNLINIYIFMQ